MHCINVLAFAKSGKKVRFGQNLFLKTSVHTSLSIGAPSKSKCTYTMQFVLIGLGPPAKVIRLFELYDTSSKLYFIKYAARVFLNGSNRVKT